MMRKLTRKVKLMMIALLAVTGAAGVALTVRGQGEGQKQQEQAKYRSTIQVRHDKNERGEADEAEGAESKEENEASEANEANETGDHEDGDEAEDRAEGAESERLKSLARITPDQAQAAALAQVPGKVKKIELENEDGNVVYGVEIKTADGESDVKVDAGDGRVLHVDKDGDGE
jgi:uncharacterized membrane protein YkoI